MRLLFLSLSILFVFSGVVAQKTKTVECEYTFHAPENYTLEQAKNTAIERARIQAIANEFGTIVSQTNLTDISADNVDFHSVGFSEVKGEWIEDIEKPVLAVDFMEGMIVVTARVKGKARELKAAKTDCCVRVLRNGKEDNFESDSFFDGDQFYISFQSPTSGYIAAYLSDGKGIVSCLLPYAYQPDTKVPVKANKRYLLFDPASGNEFTEEYYFTCGPISENNQIYVIFSPNSFTKALDRTAENANSDIILPRELTEAEFQKWLARCRRHDTDMQVIRKDVKIKRQQ